MEKLGLNQIRKMFLDFYKTKEHYVRGSFSLVPNNDKSLLIINSGMAPLKPFFSGLETPPSKRMATCQKCIRTDDIENVGLTARHGTFFEMLGSFSFGDYFKEESITWGWEFVTEVLKLPKEKIWATVYFEDDEAFDIWKNKIGMPEEKIVRLGKDDNFWEIGTGPCGPCSEIYFDRGEEYGCGSDDCKPGCDCDRYIEFWNHVFTQFSKQEDGSYENLAHPNIDTGMGLERVACIMQETDSIFDVDTIKMVVDKVCELANIKYMDGASPTDVSVRIITDHIRSATFMIGDTIMPSNEGRGYVLRRLIRRAVRHGKKIGINDSFLSKLAGTVIESSKDGYPDLEDQRIFIQKIISQEEERFAKTLNQGLSIIEEYIDEMKANGETKLSGEKAFKLHDTYGFPFEITEEILQEKGYNVDKDEFDVFMQRQRELGKSDAAKSDEGWKESEIEHLFDIPTVFTGYEKFEDTGKVLSIFKDNSELASISKGETGNVLLDTTPFYAKGGGQSSDIGYLSSDNAKAEVVEVTKHKGVNIHKVNVLDGEIKKGDSLFGKVDLVRRNNSSRNHTCTHILHQALRDVLGEHVQQAGSAVDDSLLRFDFSHFEAMTKEQLQEVEQIVNEKISMFIPVTCVEMPIAEAKKTGALGLFEDKYGDTVRVVSVGDYSKELCGGIHVANSGQIGAFKILSETGIAAGVRRIEAVTGKGLLAFLNQKEALIENIAQKLNSKPNLIDEKITSFIAEADEMKNELQSLKKQNANNISGELLQKAENINNISFISHTFNDLDSKDLREIADDLKKGNEDVAIVFANITGDKTMLLVALSDMLVKKGYHAGKLIKEIAKVAGGNGGGKPNMAQAGIKDNDKINEAFKLAKTLL